MTRRILLAFVGLTMAILAAAVIPLGIEATAHDYHDYVEDSVNRARTAAGSAEEWLGDNNRGPVRRGGGRVGGPPGGAAGSLGRPAGGRRLGRPGPGRLGSR